MKKITIFEISLTGIILSIALTAKWIDNFIPHVHPLHVIVLLLGIVIMRFRMSFILVCTYICLKFTIFGIREITAFMLAMHVIQMYSLLLVAFIRLFRNKSFKFQTPMLVALIIFTMLVYLTFMIIGDSDYSPHSIAFHERVRLALIWPGDWLNVLITTCIAIPVITFSYITFISLLEKNWTVE